MPLNPCRRCCGSASCWCGSGCGSGFDLSPWCGSGSGFVLDADPEATFHPDVDPDRDPDPWKSAQICSYFIHFGSSSANWCGSGSGSSLSLRCGSGFLFDADADPGYQNNAEGPDPDPQLCTCNLQVRLDRFVLYCTLQYFGWIYFNCTICMKEKNHKIHTAPVSDTRLIELTTHLVCNKRWIGETLNTDSGGVSVQEPVPAVLGPYGESQDTESQY